ncbi:TPA: LuxR family transcriptional regulator [Shigella flexneri]|nr:LuxR family transcriptional regulator [Shigella flexneri]HCR6380666.1 LuxR family transcriptional regulator [Shigella flexneri]HCR6916176.1 LuxR family transcriptional regulator [Shigella flexneri]HCR8390984.1 LuxR family transcriptional regulator [Shigella flexneri]HCR8713174.1 LuxR family transcriptional regulator [Shigella flexneri]
MVNDLTYKKLESTNINCNILSPENTTWTNVTVIGLDLFAICGVCSLLKRVGGVKLQVFTSLPTDMNVLTDSSIVIWVKMRHDGLPELAGHIVKVCRRYRLMRQLVISDAIPEGMTNDIGPLSRVWLTHGSAKVDILLSSLRKVLNAHCLPSPLFIKRLGRVQWRVLLLRAKGISTRKIAEICGIGLKTVSAHESAIRERLGTRNKSEYVWLVRNAQLIQQAIPALGRDASRYERCNNMRTKQKV